METDNGRKLEKKRIWLQKWEYWQKKSKDTRGEINQSSSSVVEAQKEEAGPVLPIKKKSEKIYIVVNALTEEADK